MTDEVKQDMTLSEYWYPESDYKSVAFAPTLSSIDYESGIDWKHSGDGTDAYWIRIEGDDGIALVRSVSSMVKEFTFKSVGTDLWIDLIWEEAQELFEAYDKPLDADSKTIDSTNLLKEMADLVYVVHGLANELGWDLDEAIQRVHESNMSKLDDNGQPIYREDGKRIKGPNYKPPYLEDLVK